MIDRGNRTITYNYVTRSFYRHQSVIFKGISALILAGPIGMTRERLYEVVHGDCPEGGTIGGPHDVHVWLCQTWKPALDELGFVIRRRKAYGENRMVYSIHVV